MPGSTSEPSQTPFPDLLLLCTHNNKSKRKDAGKIHGVQLPVYRFQSTTSNQPGNELSATVQFIALSQAPIKYGQSDSGLIHGDPRPAARLNRMECLLAPASIDSGCNRRRTRVQVVAIHAEHKAVRPWNECKSTHPANLPRENPNQAFAEVA